MPEFTDKHYRPLPPCVEVRKSNSEGNGLFTVEDIPGGSRIGITHLILDSKLAKEVGSDTIRTPLGGFLNHSDTPNSVLITKGSLRVLYTVVPIPKDTEISIYYTIGYLDIKPNYGGPKSWDHQ